MFSLFSNLTLLLEALEKGKAVAKPELWSKRADLTAKLTIFLTALFGLSKAFGYDLHIGAVDTATVASGIAIVGTTVVNLMHVASNDKAGK